MADYKLKKVYKKRTLRELWKRAHPNYLHGAEPAVQFGDEAKKYRAEPIPDPVPWDEDLSPWDKERGV